MVDPNSLLNNPIVYSNSPSGFHPAAGSLGSGTVVATQNWPTTGLSSTASATPAQNDSIQTSGSRGGNGREMFYENHWWYYTPRTSWLYYDNRQWNPYTASGSPSAAVSGASPTWVLESQIRAMEQGNFGVATASPGGPFNEIATRLNTATPGMGIDVNGIPLEVR
jgi:hypothetical protein